MLRTSLATTLLFWLVLPSASLAQTYGATVGRRVDVPVPHIPQETAVWCWAAVAEQILASTLGRDAPRQCELVAEANGAPAAACCTGWGSGTTNPNCVRAGATEQIEALIESIGERNTARRPRLSPGELLRQLRRGRPVIAMLQTGMNTGHVVVIRGLRVVEGEDGRKEAILRVNDPMQPRPIEMHYSDLARSWTGSIVIAAE